MARTIKTLLVVVLALSTMTFEKYLASLRPQTFRVVQNPHADVFAQDLQKYLETVTRWIDGKTDTDKMRLALAFFHRNFQGQFRPTEGKKLYRGQQGMDFDGLPRSYTYDKWVAAGFASQILTAGMVVERKVCFQCCDKRAFLKALDLAKLLKAYSGHKYAVEKEVVVLNTYPCGKAAKIYAYGT
jgi:hypothetical protein